jgi:hypothetical protein
MASQRWEHIKKRFRRRWEPNEILFHIFLVSFFSVITIVVALRVAGVQGTAMTYFGVLSAVFAFLAILTLIRIKMEPKDARLDTLIKLVTELGEKIDNLAVKIETLHK